MRYSVFLLALGALFAVLLTPLSMRAATAMGAIDRPDGARKRHARPTPRLGGLAVYTAVFLGALWLLPSKPLYAAWLAGGGLLCALGVTDDLFSLSPTVKLVAQTAIATVPVAFGFAPNTLSFGAPSLSLAHPFDNLFALLWVLLLTNAFNLIDGQDGLAVTMCATAALPLWVATGEVGALLLFGASLGFLPYNRPSMALPHAPALGTRSFLGDTGALFLGYSLALFSLGTSARFSLFTPLLFALPLYDLCSVFFRRLLRGKNPFAADRSHIHHRLADKGLSRGAVLLLLALCALCFSSFFLFLEAVTHNG